MADRIQRKPSGRVEALPQNYFSILEEKIANLKAAGKDVIRLDIGSPNMAPPEEIIECLVCSAHNPANHGYQSLRGPVELRNAWAAYYALNFKVALDSETEILSLMGSKEGIFNFTGAWAEPGSIVIVPDPGYMTYNRAALYNGAEPYYLALDPANDFLPDFSTIPQEVLERTCMLWLNYPNNPTAAVVDLATFENAVCLARKYGFWVCHDAAYGMVTFEGYRAPSILQIPGAKEVSVEFNSLSKSHNMAGWRVGAVVGNARAIQPLTLLEANINSGQFRPLIDAAVLALTEDSSWMLKRNEQYQHRRDIIVGSLADLGIQIKPPRGAIYVWTPIPAGWTSVDFVLDVLEKTGVSFTPGTVFGRGGEGYMRISLTAEEERIRDAMLRLKSWRKI